MNFFETQDFFKEMYPNKLVTFTFDDNCVRQLECIMTEGLPNIHHHIEYNKVKVSVEDMPARYVPIQPHRMITTWSEYKKLITSKNEVNVHPDKLKLFKEAKNDPKRQLEYKFMIDEFQAHSGMAKEVIEKKFINTNL